MSIALLTVSTSSIVKSTISDMTSKPCFNVLFGLNQFSSCVFCSFGRNWMVTWAERVTRGVSLLFAWFLTENSVPPSGNTCSGSLKIANFFFELLFQLLCLVPLKRYIPIKSLYPIHTDRLYP